MAKRLTEEQKKEIIISFCAGKNIEYLSAKFNCTNLTIIRNLKKNIGEEKFKELIKKNKLSNLDSDKKDQNISSTEKNNNDKNKKVEKIASQEKNNNGEFDDQYFSVSPFTEIIPLDCEIDNLPQKDLASVSIEEVKFPNIVYMIVDKNIELETKYLRDYPDWQFLPKDELNRKTIEVHFDIKDARRFCNKEQKVIKVPNTDVFRIASPILLSKGITRIITRDKLIAL